MAPGPERKTLYTHYFDIYIYMLLFLRRSRRVRRRERQSEREDGGERGFEETGIVATGGNE